MSAAEQKAPKPRVIPVTADPLYPRMPRAKLFPFQGELKEMSTAAYEQLRDLILRHGFFMPVFYWRNPKTKKCLTVDGHQRLRVIDREGWVLDGDVPVAPVKAKDEHDLAEKLLAINAQFGRISHQGLFDFMEIHALPLETLDTMTLPDFKLDFFKEEFFGTPNLGGEDEEPEEEDGGGGQPPASAVRMVQLFFNGKTHPQFMEDCQVLAEHFGTENISDTCLKVVRYARDTLGT